MDKLPEQQGWVLVVPPYNVVGHIRLAVESTKYRKTLAIHQIGIDKGHPGARQEAVRFLEELALTERVDQVLGCTHTMPAEVFISLFDGERFKCSAPGTIIRWVKM